jgi:hypothetical protein
MGFPSDEIVEEIPGVASRDLQGRIVQGDVW